MNEKGHSHTYWHKVWFHKYRIYSPVVCWDLKDGFGWNLKIDICDESNTFYIRHEKVAVCVFPKSILVINRLSIKKIKYFISLKYSLDVHGRHTRFIMVREHLGLVWFSCPSWGGPFSGFIPFMCPHDPPIMDPSGTKRNLLGGPRRNTDNAIHAFLLQFTSFSLCIAI
jgi:hypothetical protein